MKAEMIKIEHFAIYNRFCGEINGERYIWSEKWYSRQRGLRPNIEPHINSQNPNIAEIVRAIKRARKDDWEKEGEKIQKHFNQGENKS